MNKDGTGRATAERSVPGRCTDTASWPDSGSSLRLDALGQRFVESGLVASDEFDFNQPAAVGGPEDALPADSFGA